MIDLDHFKRINDELGHPAGDRILAGAARAIASTVRDVDLPARVGGEEFAVVLRDPGVAAEVAEHQRLLGAPSLLSGISRTYQPKDEEGRRL